MKNTLLCLQLQLRVITNAEFKIVSTEIVTNVKKDEPENKETMKYNLYFLI